MTQQTDKEALEQVRELVEEYARRLYKFVHRDLEWGHRPFQGDTSFEQFEQKCKREALQLLLLDESLYLYNPDLQVSNIRTNSGDISTAQGFTKLAPILKQLLKEMK